MPIIDSRAAALSQMHPGPQCVDLLDCYRREYHNALMKAIVAKDIESQVSNDVYSSSYYRSGGSLYTGWIQHNSYFFHVVRGMHGNSSGPSLFNRSSIRWGDGRTPHRIDGPAVICGDYGLKWALYGEVLSLNAFLERTPIPNSEKVLLKMQWG